jgi:hypothetical protein
VSVPPVEFWGFADGRAKSGEIRRFFVTGASIAYIIGIVRYGLLGADG